MSNVYYYLPIMQNCLAGLLSTWSCQMYPYLLLLPMWTLTILWRPISPSEQLAIGLSSCLPVLSILKFRMRYAADLYYMWLMEVHWLSS